MNRIKVSTYAQKVGLSSQAVRSYFHAGMISGIQLDTGTILLDDPDEALAQDKGVALYSRVEDKDDTSFLLSHHSAQGFMDNVEELTHESS